MSLTQSRIKNLRKDKGWSLEQLGKISNTSKSYIWHLENYNGRPSAQKLADIAKALSVNVDYLMGFDELETALDRAFYDKYLQLNSSDKLKIQQILEIIKND